MTTAWNARAFFFGSLLALLFLQPCAAQAQPLPKSVGVGSNPPGSLFYSCLLYTSPSPRDRQKSRMPSSA